MTWSSWLRLIIGDCWPDWTFWGFTVFCRRRRRCRRRWVSLKWRIFVTHFDWQFPSHKQQSICNYYDFLRVRQKTKTIFHQSLKQKDDSNGLIFFRLGHNNEQKNLILMRWWLSLSTSPYSFEKTSCFFSKKSRSYRQGGATVDLAHFQRGANTNWRS